MPERSVEDLVAQLEAELQVFTGGRLPPTRELARRFHVRRSTVLAALHVLRDKGLLDFRPGQYARVRRAGGGAGGNLEINRRSAVERLFENLRAEIASGELRAGTQLPKVNFYVRQEGLSNRTVAAAYARLVKEKLAHRKGKSWLVGRPRQSAGVTVKADPAVILILQANENSWRGLHRAERTAPFCAEFLNEAQRSGVQVHTVVAEETAAADNILPTGKAGISGFVRELGDRYRGALIAASTKEIPGIDDWLFFLSGFGCPVAWFDRYDEDTVLKRERRLFARCHFSETRAVKAALEHLWECGHRTIGYGIDYGGWTHRRWQIVESGWGQLDAGRPAVCHPSDRLFFSESRQAQRRDEVLRLLDNGRIVQGYAAAFARRHHIPSSTTPAALAGLISHDRLGRFTSILARYLMTPGLTAMVASHDYDARFMYCWFRAAGVRIPRDLSLISFDNYLDLQPLPVSTIDFGFGHLGYRAFHYLLQDIPVVRGRRGDIPAKPFVVDRGSVARLTV